MEENRLHKFLRIVSGMRDVPPTWNNELRRAKSEWPTRGPDFNAWHENFGKLADMIQRNPDLWLHNSRLKYLRFNVDTRSGHFIVTDRDGNRISPDQIVAAVRKTI